MVPREKHIQIGVANFLRWEILLGFLEILIEGSTIWIEDLGRVQTKSFGICLTALQLDSVKIFVLRTVRFGRKFEDRQKVTMSQPKITLRLLMEYISGPFGCWATGAKTVQFQCGCHAFWLCTASSTGYTFCAAHPETINEVSVSRSLAGTV